MWFKVALVAAVVTVNGCQVQDDYSEAWHQLREFCIETRTERIMDMRWALQKGLLRDHAHCVAVVEFREKLALRRPRPHLSIGLVMHDHEACSHHICEAAQVAENLAKTTE